ncbi:Short C-terminal domain-containing protein [Streptomyces sp. KS_5]|nr:Short C-terminal domain-containing protein [Streptomyces sp. PAN_FS17]SED48176.1 Short C-terminal domain-containing protein [Streptomyces sp. KS_5]
MREVATEEHVPHTMSRMGDVLAGFHAAWEFESDSVLIRYERGIRTPKLFQTLGERRVPYAAIGAVTLTPGKRGTVALRIEPRPGADPLLEAAAGQLKESGDPYRLVLPAERETLAEYYGDELRAQLTESGPAEEFLVGSPEVPMHFKAYDAKATFDGNIVRFRWFWTGASSAKWKAGDQSFPVAELSGVEWRSPEVFEGHLRLLRRDSADEQPAQADQDPAAVVFGLGYGPVHESLPFAAAVLSAVRRSGPVAAVPASAPRRDPADIAERIRHLGELHEAGLVTDEEFSSKKAELLAEL